MRNFGLKIIFWLNKIFWLLGLRHQRQLGVIYDSVTKEPVDPVLVKLIDMKTSKVIASNIANLKGEYGFIADPGLYQIYVQRPHYQFPSRKIEGARDGVYYPLYRGETFEFVGGKDVISMCIPLDPLTADWNQQAKRATVKTYPVLYSLIIALVSILFWFGFVLAGINFAAARSGTWLGVLLAYSAIILGALTLPHMRLWGRVRVYKGKLPVVGVLVEVSHVSLPDVIIAKATTVVGGKFFIRLSRGTYTLVIKQPVPGDEPIILGRHTIHVGSEGVINKEIYV